MLKGLEHERPLLKDQRPTLTFEPFYSRLTYQVRIMSLALTVLKNQISKISNLNALGSKFDLDV